MTRYEYLQNEIDKITDKQRANKLSNMLGMDLINNLLENNKQQLIAQRDKLSLKDAGKKAGWFWRFRF